MSKRFSVIPAVYLVFIKQSKVLLSRRKNTGFADGWYGLVAGHVEAGETLLQAMIREANEEADIKLDADDLQLASVINRRSDDRVSVDFFFLCNDLPVEPLNREPDKCTELGFYSLSDLPSKTIPYVKQGILNCFEQKTYGEAGWDQIWTGSSSADCRC